MFSLFPNSRTVRINPEGKRPKGFVTLSYLTEPFLGTHDSAARGHTNWQECRAIAESWRERGFRVEVVDRKDRRYFPPAGADAVVDLGVNLERWADRLGAGCRKILHATGAHWLTQNTAELSRLESLKTRRGVSLLPRRQNIPNRGIESADVACVLGNDFTIDSFRFAGKPVHRIPISSAYEFSWCEERDWEACRRRFLWIGSLGMVHKGLDLVLEAFAERPHLHLTVCGRPEKEPDFWNAYRRELKELPNINFVGWVDMGSPQFEEIRRTHGAVVYPSCSEGGGGAVIHCMHGGLVPLVTHAASVDIGDFGHRIDRETPGSVGAALDTCAGWAPEEIGARARASWEHARMNHTLPAFRTGYQRFLDQFLG
jgi:glycosyltransferase involved in cell wall biosynthesis